MSCTTRHQGNDPREENNGSAADTSSGLTMRKMVNPDTCLMCHGTFNYQVMGLPVPGMRAANCSRTTACCANGRYPHHPPSGQFPETGCH
ncbi:MAG: hypothetical protein R3E95_16320 [Thiolinea sp.]